MNINNFNRDYLQYLFPQRTRLTTEYELTKESTQSEIDNAINLMIEKDFNMIEEYLPTHCDRSLDIGCGLGLINILLYKKYKSTNIYLLDKTELNVEEISGIHKNYKFYNSMQAAKETITLNGIEENKLNLYETTDYKDLFNIKFDVIFSLLSCGWHYPVSTYIDLLSNSLSDDGVLILDLRHNTDQLDILTSHFILEKQIYNYTESKHTGGNIGDRYIFKRKI